MRNRDGGQWRLSWEKTERGYRGWVEKHPKHAAEAATFDEMAERVYALVDEYLHAGEWTADWSPPPPAQPGSRGEVLESHMSLAWEGRFVCLQDPRAVFKSHCEWCGMPTGPRTGAPLRMFIEDPGNVCGDFDTAPGKLVILSSDLAENIQKLATGGAEFRPVSRVGRGKSFVEPVVGGRLPKPVALKDQGELGWACPECGHRYMYHSPKLHRTTTFYKQSELPVHLPVFWMLNGWGCAELCIRADWWKKNRGSTWAKGAVAHPIGVAADDDVDRKPTLETLKRMRLDGGYRKYWKHKQRRLAESYGKPFEPWE